jgi:hypothetical protein
MISLNFQLAYQKTQNNFFQNKFNSQRANLPTGEVERRCVSEEECELGE